MKRLLRILISPIAVPVMTLFFIATYMTGFIFIIKHWLFDQYEDLKWDKFIQKEIKDDYITNMKKFFK